jgi:hypothetical protein
MNDRIYIEPGTLHLAVAEQIAKSAVGVNQMIVTREKECRDWRVLEATPQ